MGVALALGVFGHTLAAPDAGAAGRRGASAVSAASASAGGAAARAASLAAAATPVVRPPLTLLVRWQPLRPALGAPALARPELRPATRAWRAKRWLVACTASVAVWDAAMTSAARLFYAPVRKGANVDGIERFLTRYVRGKAPLVAVAADVFVPAPPLRDLAVDACTRAGKPALADRLLSQVALTDHRPRLRTALAVVRLHLRGHVDEVVLLVGSAAAGGARVAGARAWLIRALRKPEREAMLQLAKTAALPAERALVTAVTAWLRSLP